MYIIYLNILYYITLLHYLPDIIILACFKLIIDINHDVDTTIGRYR